jgi:hypothetical protein
VLGGVFTITVAACSPPLEFPAWVIPLAESAPVIDYAGVPLEERTEQIELVADLTLGGDQQDANQSFYRPTSLAVADDGRLYVFERGNLRIQAFDAAGAFLMSIGRQGQGPGEFDRGGGGIAVAGDRLVRSGDSRLSVWSLAGELIEDSALPVGALAPIDGLAGGRVVGLHGRVNEDESITETFSRVTSSAEIEHDYAAVTVPRRVQNLMSEQGMTIVRLPGPTPAAQASRDGGVYVTGASEYQVHAFEADGSARWALRSTWERLPVDDDDLQRAVLRGVGDTQPRDLDVTWPQYNPALAGEAGSAGGRALLLDGHGHLYVFPFVREPVDGRFPVDVYGADGERLFAGWIAVNGWEDALGDFVYRFETRASDEESLVVRYRIVEPFD